MAVEEFAMPDLGEGLTEADLVSWLVAEGDTVELNQTIAEVETAKALVQVPSPFEGTVARLHVEEGTTVPVGTTILSVRTSADEATADDDAATVPGTVAGRAPSAAAGQGAAAADGTPSQDDADDDADVAPTRTSVLVGYGPPVEGGKRPRRRERAASWSARHGGAAALAGGRRTGPPSRPGAGDGPRTPSGDRPRCFPPVRKLAHDLGVDLCDVEGTGPAGVVTRDDVLAASTAPERVDSRRGTGSTPPAGAPSASGASAREERIPITGVRKHTAAAMVASAFTAPHATEFLTVDVTPTSDLLARLAADRRHAGHRVGVLAFVAKAVTVVLRHHPTLNARWDEEAGEIVRYGYVNLGIAAATPRGLVVPNVKDADRMDLVALADAIRELAEQARAGATPPSDMTGGTISITNIGVFGIDAGTPILVPGEAAILALGAVRRMPWEHRGEVALRDVLTLSLSFDHRLVDGEQASRFLRDVGDVLADPARLVTLV